ncbi:MAG: glycosyltransferase family 2 protein [Pseudomonadota bacterium]
MSERAGRDDITFVVDGVRLPPLGDAVPPAALEARLRADRATTVALDGLIGPDDRLLELGGGVGMVSTGVALEVGAGAVMAVEPDPDLVPLLRETHRLNGVEGVMVLHGIAAAAHDPARDRPALALANLIAGHRPTILVAGPGALVPDALAGLDLSGLTAVILTADLDDPEIVLAVEAAGFHAAPGDPEGPRRFLRAPAVAAAATEPPAAPSPRVLVTTCMKDEGPFILEWLAWHQSIGIDDYVVFTNDCTDGTDLILDRLEELGHLQHLPNPAIATGNTHFQPVALSYTPHLPAWRKADYYISIDVDEFINVRVGRGAISDLLDAAGPFDALSMSELNHGANGRVAFEPGLMTEQFPRHQTEAPGRWKAARGVKTIVRLSEKLEKPRNHRPDFHADQGPVRWIDGSARPIETLAADPSLNGIDVRGSYDLVSLNHFPLRSLESYLIKMFRGDVVVKDKRVSHRYWRVRNRDHSGRADFSRQQPAFRRALDALMADETLAALHQRACGIHRDRAAALLEAPEYCERRDWILENAWPDLPED